MIRFDPQPSRAELPERMPSPFVLPPHPLAMRAAEALKRDLSGLDLATLDRPGAGKMFGVLVVADTAGQLGYLQAFSGMLEGRWEVAGFAPPTFDAQAKDAFWPAFEAQLDEDDLREEELERRLSEAGDDALRDQLAALRAERADRSRRNWIKVTDTYRLTNARAEVRTVTELFSPLPPPGAAGDCAGPKLLAEAYRRGLKPIAFAEFWWGAPSTDGVRTAGVFAPACDRRCRVVLPFMLEGVEVEAMPPPSEEEDRIEILFEDEWLLVAWKPVGLPSKPGGRGRDSLLSRIRRTVPTAGLAFALEADRSGLVVVAKDSDSLATLQRSFGTGASAITAARVSLVHPRSAERLELSCPEFLTTPTGE